MQPSFLLAKNTKTSSASTPSAASALQPLAIAVQLVLPTLRLSSIIAPMDAESASVCTENSR